MDYEITLPVLEDLDGYKSILYIEQSSKINHKEALELFASYFKRECRYTNLQYCASEHPEGCIGVLFLERASDLVQDEEHYPNRVIGGACFDYNESDKYFLDWVWFHPFARNRKHLKNQWEIFKEKFGSFTLTKPLSAQMEKFIEKHA